MCRFLCEGDLFHMLGAGIREGYGLVRGHLSLVLSDSPAIQLLSKSESED